MFIWRWLRIYDDHEIVGLFIMAKVNACIWLTFELLFANLIHSDSKPWASHGHVWPPNLQQWGISALPFHTFMGVMIYREVLFLAGEPFFAWRVTCRCCFSNLEPLKSIPRSSLLDSHSLSFVCFCFCLCPLTAPRDHSENWLRSLYLFLTGNSLPGLAGTGNSLHGWEDRNSKSQRACNQRFGWTIQPQRFPLPGIVTLYII